MLANHAARVAAIAAGLGTKARGMRRHFDRQCISRHDLVAHGVRQRYFRCRDQIQRFALTFLTAFLDGEQISFEFRQLAGAAQRIGVHDIRRIALGVTML